MTVTEACLFCGQIQQFDDHGMEMTKDELIQEATMHCDCEEARRYQGQQRAMTDAKLDIKAMFQPNDETAQDNMTIDNLCSIANLIIGKRIKSATIIMNNAVKCKMTENKDGFIKISKEIIKKEGTTI